MGPKSNDRYLYKKKRIMEVTQRECYIMMEEEIGITQLQVRKAKDHWEPPEARAAQLASIRQMSSKVWRDSACEYQADDRAGVAGLSSRVSG